MKIWLLFQDDGDSFCGAYLNKPTLNQIKEVISFYSDEFFIDLLHTGRKLDYILQEYELK